MGRRNILVKIAVILLILGLFGGIGAYIVKNYKVENVYVNGNVHYTQEEVRDMVLDGSPLSDNSIFLSFMYKDREVTDIPFIDVLRVEVLSPDTIRIDVSEKKIIGYLAVMDSCMYFDKDGYIVESSEERTAGIPQITGLMAEHVVLGEKLTVEDDAVFDEINTIYKTLEKSGLDVENIFFRSDGKVVIYFGDVKVNLGELDEYLEDKITVLPGMLSELQGMSGTLSMEEYNDAGEYLFKADKN